MTAGFRFPPQTGRATAVKRVAQAMGMQVDPHDGISSRPAIDAALAAGYGWSNPRLAWRDPEDLGAAGAAVRHPAAAQSLVGPTFLNGRPDCFPPVESRGPWRSQTPAVSLLHAPFGYLATAAGSPVALGGDRAVIPRFSSAFAGLVHLYDVDLGPMIGGARLIEGRALVLLDDVFGTNYCLWLINWLPRLSLMRNPGEDVHAIVSPLTAPWQAEMLTAGGLSPRQIVEVQPWDVVQARHLFVPAHLSEVFHPGFKASPWALDHVRGLFLSPDEMAAPPTRRLYVSRRDAAGRRVVNEAALIERLAGLGFEEVVLSGMSIRDQARLFAAAEMVVAPHGAGLTNLVFCAPGVRVVEVFARTYGTPAFWIVADGRGLDYATYIVDRVASGSRAQLDDLELDLADFEASAVPFLMGRGR